MTARRIPRAEREKSIARAAARLFAEKGFHETTTRELSAASGISEALMLRYFPNKHSLLSAAFVACREASSSQVLDEFQAIPPSAAALVRFVIAMAQRHEIGLGEDHIDRDTANRMLMRSLCEDGRFAKVMAEEVGKKSVGYVQACLVAAHASGDLDEIVPQPASVAAWLRFHMISSVMYFELPSKSPIAYETDEAGLLRAAVIFQLRGLGLSSESLRRHLPAKMAAQPKPRAAKRRKSKA